ncbi:MAG: Smr/MutS family protein [Pseudobacteriovorax sp.]|nr:Smr/MutS family protein [Pseudobacteriovorax sp.]
MKPVVLEKLQWSVLLNKLSNYAQTPAGSQFCLDLKPEKSKEDIESNWSQVIPLRDLIVAGYTPPIGETPVLDDVFRFCSIGQLLDGPSLRAVYTLLDTVKSLQTFTRNMVDRCPTLVRFNSLLYPLPKLMEAIGKSIDHDGEILDTASPELIKIRRQKQSIRKTIEKSIKQLLSDHQVEQYLQDKFFTLRSERYVVPMKLDGRGRVQGSIQDTSDSGQTLFIEPESIKPHNDHLLELEVNEKLEILRIFRSLSEQTAAELDILRGDYDAIVELDTLTAQARLAADINGTKVSISSEPKLNLMEARHPLVKKPSGETAVANNIGLVDKQSVLIVSGPNAGGKTIVLKTAGLLLIMAKAGLLIPANQSSALFLPDNVFLELGDSQSLEGNLSTFSGHVLGLKPILEESGPNDLVLLDELAVGTEPQTGSAIGQAVLEEIGKRKSIGIVTTHFDNLKSLALKNPAFRNGSMEFSMEKLLPTYKLILDIPGQSRGIEVAEQMGLSKSVVDRAKELRGKTTGEMDQIIDDMFLAKQKAEEEAKQYQQLRLEMEAQKARWQQDRNELQASKARISEKVKNKYEDQIEKLKIEFNNSLGELKAIIKRANLPTNDEIRSAANEAKKAALENLQNLDSGLQKLGDQFKVEVSLPGEEAKVEDLKVGSKVYVISLQKEASITKIQKNPLQIEVAMGLIKVKPSLQDLRTIKAGKKQEKKKIQNKPKESKKVGFVVPSPTNSLDLRGSDMTRAVEKTWDFIDKAVLRGETSLIVIHGHGTDTLKKSIRTALAKESPYELDFRPGEKEEGGDGVTVVQLRI